MKRILIASFGLLAATSLIGATEDTQQQKTTTATTAATTTSAPAAAATGTEDSPLVRAAKSAHRADNKKRIVITNEDLKHSQGHVTTTKTLPPVYMPKSGSGEEMTDAQMKALEKQSADRKKEAEAKAKAKSEGPKNARRATDDAESDEYFAEDPAAAEHQQAEAAKAAQQQQQQKPPEKQ